jgi:maltose alpha-D-glucosyltransferase/alpha-amylase
MPGTPFVYYGDEIGMKQLHNLPFTEGSYAGRAGDRTPMQWNNSQNKGFSSVDPSKLYRAVDSAADAPEVATEDKDPNSLLNKVKELIKLHNTEPALLAYAEFVPVYAQKDKYPLAYIRANGKNRLLVVLNPANRDEAATFTLNYKSQKPLLISGNGTAVVKDNLVTVNMKSASYAVFRLNEK